ncbi:hypothetical protein L210DRAFT_3447835 [Boletus edulis BED1]|uniref:Uncharacterized protein n=1 Tax=Boletus edulis BED1 TaxID=1328754 RepID=A0AAD4BW01_BOLED|nr:hypothetical protein L210DRAFT_3447835 [Boletus edulis BED1]
MVNSGDDITLVRVMVLNKATPLKGRTGLGVAEYGHHRLHEYELFLFRGQEEGQRWARNTEVGLHFYCRLESLNRGNASTLGAITSAMLAWENYQASVERLHPRSLFGRSLVTRLPRKAYRTMLLPEEREVWDVDQLLTRTLVVRGLRSRSARRKAHI